MGPLIGAVLNNISMLHRNRCIYYFYLRLAASLACCVAEAHPTQSTLLVAPSSCRPGSRFLLHLIGPQRSQPSDILSIMTPWRAPLIDKWMIWWDSGLDSHWTAAAARTVNADLQLIGLSSLNTHLTHPTHLIDLIFSNSTTQTPSTFFCPHPHPLMDWEPCRPNLRYFGFLWS